jgi:hypothetical protein
MRKASLYRVLAIFGSAYVTKPYMEPSTTLRYASEVRIPLYLDQWPFVVVHGSSVWSRHLAESGFARYRRLSRHRHSYWAAVQVCPWSNLDSEGRRHHRYHLIPLARRSHFPS